MERYYNDRYDYEDEDFDDPEEAFAAFLDAGDAISLIQIDVSQIELNHRLLDKATVLAEKSFFWRFKSPIKKMEEIEAIYKKLYELVGNSIMEVPEEEPEEPEKDKE